MTTDTILTAGCCGSDSSCSASGCTGDAKTCKKADCCKKGDSEKKSCDKCGTALKSGMKYEDICTTCNPTFKEWCSGCERRLWDCMCIKPHTWE